MTKTLARGTPYYMSPELVLITRGSGTGKFNPTSCDIFSLGITWLRFVLTLKEQSIEGMNDIKKG